MKNLLILILMFGAVSCYYPNLNTVRTYPRNSYNSYSTTTTDTAYVDMDAIRSRLEEGKRSYNMCKLKYGKEMADKITMNELAIGMTAEMVIESWGEPESKNVTETAYGTHEQWVYGGVYRYDKMKFAYFENGIVTSFQY